MKHIVFSAMLGVATPAFGQAQKPEAPKPEAKSEPAKPMATPAVAKKMNPKRQEDARHCLDKATNTEVIKCAEEYL
jgi:hypothetical protein